MDVFKLEIPPGRTNEVIERLNHESDIFWIRFGREILFFDNAPPENNFSQKLTHLHSFTDEDWQTRIYIVVQKGRLFQKHYPNVRVIHDRGRFLLVRLDSGLVDKLMKKDHSEYGLMPIKSRQAVFEEHDLADFREPPTPAIQTLVDTLERDKFRETLELLTGFHTRYSSSPDYLRAASLMASLLADLSYEIWSQPFRIDCTKNSLNIIADKPGTGAGQRDVVIVSAHLDSVGVRDGDHIPAPGADDNASGCAGLIEIARVFENHEAENDLRLILFGGEEQGFMGSKHYVENLSPAERRRVKAIVNMDMIGFRDDPSQNILIEGAPVSQRVIDGFLEAAATYTGFSTAATSLDSDSSDHKPFIRAGMPAVLTIEGIKGNNHAIHSAGDTINTIDFDFALEILRMNVAFIAKEIA